MKASYLLLFLSLPLLSSAEGVVKHSSADHRQLEALDRGLIGVQTDQGMYLSWRRFDSDKGADYELYRDGVKVPTSDASNVLDAQGSNVNKYELKVARNGSYEEVVPLADVWEGQKRTLKLDTPTASGVTYSPNDMSVIDVDADGQLELLLKWDPSNSQDNSKEGSTGRVFVDCLRLDGTKLWRLDLGPNIRAGAHYTQMCAYDFDGDGRGELVLKTAPGARDGLGNYVSDAADEADITAADNSAKYANSKGYVNAGPEWLTLFEGATGKALHTIFYRPNRGCELAGGGAVEGVSKSQWGDSYGGRSDRFLTAVAHLDERHNATAIMVRGYYTRAYVWAVDVEGHKLVTHWLHAAESKTKYKLIDAAGQQQEYTPGANTAGRSVGSNTLYGNGNHNMSVADVDGDGFDEVLWGAAALDHDGKQLYATGFGHGDAIHVGDFNPERPGLEVFDVHEEKEGNNPTWDLHDAATGEVLFRSSSTGVDNGRGMCAQLSPTDREAWFSSSNDRDQRSCVSGNVASSKHGSINQRIYWDGDLQDELLDGGAEDQGESSVTIAHFNGSSFESLSLAGHSCNSTKRSPCLIADLLGDWREELILWGGATTARELYIYTTTIGTPYGVTTLLHDPTYRMALAWQNGAYNQPPHIGYFLPDLFGVHVTKGRASQTFVWSSGMTPTTYELPEGVSATVTGLPDGITCQKSGQTLTISGAPTTTGSWTYTLTTDEATPTIMRGTLTATLPLATLRLRSGSATQRLQVGQATITPIVYATEHATAAAKGLPEGVAATYDNGLLTIEGTITSTAPGTWAFTVATDALDEGYDAPPALAGTLTTWAPGKLDVALNLEKDNGGLEPVGFTPTYVDGVAGQAISLSGTPATARLEKANGGGIVPATESFTLTLWVKSSMPISDAGAYLFHTGSCVADNAGASGKWVGLEYKKGNLAFSIDDNANKSTATLTGASTALFNGQWHNVTCVRDATAKKLLLYLDGRLAASGNDATGDIAQSEALVVGNSTVDYACPFVGALDVVQLYQGAASADVVQDWVTNKSNASTALATVRALEGSSDGACYDMGGHRLANAPARGLYIQGGRLREAK